MTNWRDKLRKWIDGDDLNETVLVEKSEDYESEKFLRKLLQKIDEVLLREITRLPSGTTYVPSRFVVYLNEEDDKNLRKDKRSFFEQGLGELIIEKAKERAGKSQLNAKSIKVSLKVNGTLGNGEIEVKAASDSSIELRDTLPVEDNVSPIPISQKKLQQEDFPEKKIIREVGTIPDTETIEDTDFDFKPLYRLETFRDGKMLDSFPIIKYEITVGRDEDDGAANIRLKSDNRKISRLHAGIQQKDNGEIWITALNKNPTFVSGKPIVAGEKAKLEKNGEIQIYEYTLRFKF
jgi:FHA domain/Protein of unknown function (DUF3662)